MFCQIAVTRQEKNVAAKYWEHQRKIAESIRDVYDKINEDNYHEKFYKRFTVLSERPDFLEPMPKNYRKKIN